MSWDDVRRHELCYLGTPYSKYEGGIEKAFTDTAALAGSLLILGVNVYSPITHTHPIAVYGGIDPLDHSIWIPFDMTMMGFSDAMIVAMMPGWKESYGVSKEINVFKDAAKPIYYLDPEKMSVSREN